MLHKSVSRKTVVDTEGSNFQNVHINNIKLFDKDALSNLFYLSHVSISPRSPVSSVT